MRNCGLRLGSATGVELGRESGCQGLDRVTVG